MSCCLWEYAEEKGHAGEKEEGTLKEDSDLWL